MTSRQPPREARRFRRAASAPVPADLRLAATYTEFERLRRDPAAIAWERDEAEPDLLLAGARARPQTIAPFARTGAA